MAGQTTGQSRVVDPILSTVVQGYKNAELVGNALFPHAGVPQRGGKIIEFGRESFMIYDSERAPGSNTNRIQVGFSAKYYAVTDHSLEGKVPDENRQEAQAVPGVDLASVAVNAVMDALSLKIEIAQAILATTAGNYAAENKTALTGAGKWSDYEQSTPKAHLKAGREAIRKQIGRYPNTLLLSALAFDKLKDHPDYAEKLKYTDRDSITAEMLARAMDIQNVVIGGAVYWDAVAGRTVDVWGKHAVLAYVSPSRGTLRDRGQPSYGYSYTLNGYPMARKPYRDENAQSWIYPVNFATTPVLCGMSAGYLLQNVVA